MTHATGPLHRRERLGPAERRWPGTGPGRPRRLGPRLPQRPPGELLRHSCRRSRAGAGPVTRRGHVAPAEEGRGALAGAARRPLSALGAGAPRTAAATRWARPRAHAGRGLVAAAALPSPRPQADALRLPRRPLSLPEPPPAGCCWPRVSAQRETGLHPRAPLPSSPTWEKRAGCLRAGLTRVTPPPSRPPLPAGGNGRPSEDGDGPLSAPVPAAAATPRARLPCSPGPEPSSRLGRVMLHGW